MTPPHKLYKYVPSERIDILRNGLIRFTQPSSLNDPFEMQPVFDALIPEEKLEEVSSPSLAHIEAALRQKYKELPVDQQLQFSEDQLVSLAKSNPELLKMAVMNVQPIMRNFLSTFAPKAKKLIYRGFDKHIGMLSLTETAANLLMWSHYAAAHKGFVIEFDATHEYFHRRRSDKDELYHLRKVDYVDRDGSGRTLYDLDGQDLLVTKMKIWDYEREWRILVPLKDAERVIETASERIYLFPIPEITITGVILGTKASSQLKSDIEHAVRALKHVVSIKSASMLPTTGAISIA